MSYKQLSLFDVCPMNGDPSNDCDGCVYGADYHLVDGECVLRASEPTEEKFEAPKEVV